MACRNENILKYCNDKITKKLKNSLENIIDDGIYNE
jgi:hypothetical protein